MSHDSFRGGRTALALAAVALGVTLVLIAALSQRAAPVVPPSAAGTLHAPPAVSEPPSPSGEPSPEPAKPLPASEPVSITISSIGVDSPVFPIGKNPDGTLAVPSGPRLNQAAWFENSPTPGQPGPSIIEGHVDSTQGPSVFFRLGDVRPGDTITVLRRDRIKVTFTVDAVRDFPKAEFPTKLVYGGDLGTPTLRLITCSDFDRAIGHHTGNEVVFAHLTRVTRPPTS
ncbi:class F sortase [Nocardioides mesophilus]|uniref:Class F sortase n=1 Tax=Nocardioides mesophilus TaxID=433659 RepID=A0A7G9R828_9ACTN|nr:class F sortase [Nocardioides mesophilus]QNN51753.1 class F sortase [Nocardioides mesophilus]